MNYRIKYNYIINYNMCVINICEFEETCTKLDDVSETYNMLLPNQSQCSGKCKSQ